jgi:two-component system NtrC family response regulator
MKADKRVKSESRIRELEELNRLSHAVSSTLSVEETLSAIADSCLRLGCAERVAVFLLSPSNDQEPRTLVRRSDQGEGGIDHMVNLLAAKKILERPKSFITADIVKEIHLTNPPNRVRDLGPALVTPLILNQKPIGIINLVNSRGGKQFDPDCLRVMTIVSTLSAQYIHRAKLHETLFQDNVRLKEALRERSGPQRLLGESQSMKDVRERIELVAGSDANVLLIGETGTGKELAACAIHYSSERAEKPFVAVNCAAIPVELFESELFGHEKGAFTGAVATLKGKFEIANGGTLFLDEISSMPMTLQPKLLRVIEQKTFYRVGSEVETHFDVRLIAATSVDLERAVEEGSFRGELFHRLSVVPIQIPPLRERTDDIPLLAGEFLKEFSGGGQSFGFDAVELLSGLCWKGNVRELRNAVERISIFIQTPTISGAQVSEVGVGSQTSAGSALDAGLEKLVTCNSEGTNLLDYLERGLIQQALHHTGGNITQAARLLGIGRHALQRRMENLENTASNPSGE